ncbi:MAG: hypothetical protein ABL933_18000 [Methyloglobulus sp.]|nr:hypothetical protein [Methyloglobulus sp.]
MSKRIVVGAIISLIGMNTANAASYDDGHGREWRQVDETYNASWAEMAAVCPQDGQTACNGSVPVASASTNTRDLTDWIWATDAQVRTLFSYYTPDILTSDTLSGITYLNPARGVFNNFAPLNSIVCAGGCAPGYYHYWLTGWTSTTHAALPAYGYVEADSTTIQNGVFTIASRTDGKSITTGAFLWRPTGLGSGLVYANTDSATAVYGVGSTGVINVLANDWNNGIRAAGSNVILTIDSSTDPGITINSSTGALIVAASTAPGYQNLAYHICSITTSSCDASIVRVTLPVHVIPMDDTGGGVSSTAGGVAVANVLANDRYYANGTASAPVSPTTSDVRLQQLTFPPGITLNTATGEVTVASNITPGFKELSYRICDRVVPTYCGSNTARVMFNVYDPNAVVTANPDSISATSASGVYNVLMNDTIGTQQANVSTNAIVALVQSSPELTLNTSTGLLIVPPGLPAGSYWLDYRVCDRYNTTNCATARATVTVAGPNVIIQGNADAGTVTTSGGVAIISVLANDFYGTAAATTANVRLVTVQAPAGVTLNTLTGAVSVAAGTLTGSYPLSYGFCDKLNATNCASAVATVTVRANVIDALNDSGSVKRSSGGVAIANVLANDTLEGIAATKTSVAISAVGSIPRGFTFNTATGAISVASRTSTGTYTINYRICERASAANCDQASAVVRVR